jgi:hypothetical protein
MYDYAFLEALDGCHRRDNFDTKIFFAYGNLIIHHGFNPTRTATFSERLQVFEKPDFASVEVSLKDPIQACLSSIEDPKVDMNAKYRRREWFTPAGEKCVRNPIPFFAEALVTAPTVVIEAMAERRDTDINITTKGRIEVGDGDAPPLGLLANHVDFRDRRDGRDPKCDGLHPETIGAFRALIGAPRFNEQMTGSFVWEWNAFGDLSLQKSPYLDEVVRLYRARQTVLVKHNEAQIQAALNRIASDLFDKAGKVIVNKDTGSLLSVREAEELREMTLELSETLKFSDLIKRTEDFPPGNLLTMNEKKLLNGSEPWQKRLAAKTVAGRLFISALKDIMLRQFPPQHQTWKGEPDFEREPKYRAANKIAYLAIKDHFKPERM